jgi:hypothetical protein
LTLRTVRGEGWQVDQKMCLLSLLDLSVGRNVNVRHDGRVGRLRLREMGYLSKITNAEAKLLDCAVWVKSMAYWGIGYHRGGRRELRFKSLQDLES